MKILFAWILIFLALTLGINVSVYGADTLKVVKSKLYFDNLPINNPWANSSNPAALEFLYNTQIRLVETGYSFRSKELKSPIEPGITNLFFVKTKGYKKIGKLTFYGSFGYENEQYKNLLYNNTFIFDIDDPYILGDTIGGKQRKEGFLLRGSVAYPVTDKIIIGIDADYQNFVGAKLKDPRNKNDISSLVITPGLIYNGTSISAGISGGPVIYNNDIDVSVMENGKYSMFQFMGMGYYKSLKNIISYSNAYYGKGYQAETQLKYHKDNYSNFTVINYNSSSEEVRYGNTNRLIDGISDRTGISVSNYQSMKRKENQHHLNILLNMMNLSGTELMQHFKSIVAGLYSYDTLITDSRAEGKHMVSNYSGTIEYKFTRYKDTREKFSIDLGLSADYQSANHYPVQNYGFQKVLNVIVFSGLKAYKSFPALTIIPEIGLTYRKNLSRDMDYVVTELSIPEFQHQDYIARYSDILKGKAGITLLKKSSVKYFTEYFINLDANYGYVPDIGNGSFQNVFINCSLGLIF